MGHIFSDINYLAWFVAGVAYWLVGMLWFSVIVGKSWAKEMVKEGLKVKKPTSKEMTTKSIATFVLNLVVALGIALVTYATNVSTFWSAVCLGLILGVLVAGAVKAISYIWANRGVKLSAMD